MKKRVLLIFLAVVVPALSLSAETRGIRSVTIKDPSGGSVELYKGSHALIIGVADYQNGWPALGSIQDETAELKESLEANGFVVQRVINPDSRELESAYKDFINEFGYDYENRLLFFFAGHGYSRKKGAKGYLVPVDAPDPNSNMKGFLRKALPMSQILAWSRQMEAKHALFLFDSCFSGTIFKTRALPKTPPHISAITTRPVRQFIAAGDAGEEVPAKSVFSPSFIRGLRGEADLSGDGYITGSELGMYLRDKVIYYQTGQTPQYGKIRDPNLDEGDFVFVAGLNQKPIEHKLKKITRNKTVKEDLNRGKLTIDRLKNGLLDFYLDGTDHVSESEGRRILKHLSAGNVTKIGNVLTGNFRSGYQLAIWIGSYDDIKYCYSCRFGRTDSNMAYFGSNTTFFEICKKRGATRVVFDAGAMKKYSNLRSWGK